MIHDPLHTKTRPRGKNTGVRSVGRQMQCFNYCPVNTELTVTVNPQFIEPTPNNDTTVHYVVFQLIAT